MVDSYSGIPQSILRCSVDKLQFQNCVEHNVRCYFSCTQVCFGLTKILRVITNIISHYSLQELEEAIIASGSADGSTLLTQLFIQLLKGCYPHRGIT